MRHYLAKRAILIVVLFLGTSVNLRAAGGVLDIAFSGSGRSIFNIDSSPVPGNFADIVVVSGNKFVVVGEAEIAVQAYKAVTLSRFNSDGSLDTTFGVDGKVVTDPGITAVGVALAVAPDGKILVAGNAGTNGIRRTVVVRYSADGVLDTSFANNGVFFSDVMKVARDISVLADNKILIAGDSDVPNLGITQITKLNANGSLDMAFGTNGYASSTYNFGSDTRKMAIQSDGKIVISGSNLFTVPRSLIHRFNTDGSPDTTFGTGGIREFNQGAAIYTASIAILSDGKIVLAGSVATPPFSNTAILLLRLNSDGSSDDTFGNGGYVIHELSNSYDRASDIAVQSDGKLVVSGQRSGFEAIIARFDSAGALDPGFGTGGIRSLSPGYQIPGIALQGANVVGAGTDGSSLFITRLDPAGSVLTYRYENFVLRKNDQARDVAIQTDGKIVAAGMSESSNNQVVSVARLLPNGGLDAAFGTNGKVTVTDGTSSCEAFAVRVQPDGKIVVAGRGSQSFTFTYYSLFVVRLNADGSLDTTFGTGGKVVITNPTNLIGYDMELQSDGKVVVGGTVYRLVGDGIFDYDMMAARLNANGTPDSGFGSGGVSIYIHGTASQIFFEQAKALSIAPDGKIILAGTHLLRLDPNGAVDATFSSAPVPLGFAATDIKLQSDGKIVVGGKANADFAVARYANTTLDSSFGVNGTATLDLGGTDSANAIYIEPNGSIVAGGSTLGTTRKNFALARLTPSGSPDITFGNGGKVVSDLGGDSQIFGITRQPDGKIVAAGDAKINIDRDFAVARYASRPGVFDFDGDGLTDIGIYRPNAPFGAEWWWIKSSGGNAALQFGNSTDKITPADFTGDGKTDVAFWRPSSGTWYVLRSEDFSYFAHPFGTVGDIPVPADFDADGRSDEAVFRPSTMTWFIHRSSGGTTITTFGAAGDLPVNADYDGDGKSDIAIYRLNGTNGAEWWMQRSSNGSVFATQFGVATDKAVVGDYTGDGKADLAFWRPSTGQWFISRSENFSYYAFSFGAAGDVPVPGDYDGDGKFDAGVFRPSNSNWYVDRTTAGILIRQFGISGDVPLPSAFVR